MRKLTLANGKVVEAGNELPDDYPVNYGYVYLADEKVVRSDIQGSVKDLKVDLIKTGKAEQGVKIYPVYIF